MSVDIAAENALPGTYTFTDLQTAQPQGVTAIAGFPRRPSKNVGETIDFCVTGNAIEIEILRFGWYGGTHVARRWATISNLPAAQPNPVTIPNSNGGTTATAWTTTASWAIPADAVSGHYAAMVKTNPVGDAFFIHFTVRDDAADADITYKTSDTTWAAAYNHYGTVASPLSGKNLYGSGAGIGAIQDRAHVVSYHRPVITRGQVMQTFWWACELPLIRFLERNGYTTKYITSVDLDQQGRSILQKAPIFISSGHDEYWTADMRDAVEEWRDLDAGRSIFMSGNEVFWKARFEYVGDEARLWCYKDTMPGPSGHVAGAPLDPVEWTGTWKDQRWPGNRPEWLLTGTDFRMNGVNDVDAIIPQNPYGGIPVWGGSSLVDGNLTLTRVIGFEADSIRPTQPNESVRVLAAYTRNINGQRADDNGQTYSNNGNLEWGIIAQRYAGGGLTVGFGTCQWSWMLDSTHDRFNGHPTSLAAQQFTVNLLRDLGAEPATLMAGVTLQPINELDAYGLEPVEGRWRAADGATFDAYAFIAGVLTPLL